MPFAPVGEETAMAGVLTNTGAWVELLVTVLDEDGHYTLRTSNEPNGSASFLITCPTHSDVGGDIPTGFEAWVVNANCTVNDINVTMQAS